MYTDQPNGEQNAGSEERDLLIGVAWVHTDQDLEPQPMTYKW